MTRGAVVFDLDGTLTGRDTSLSFLRFVAGAGATALGMARAGLGAPADLLRAWRAEARGPAVGGVGGRLEALLHQRVMETTLRGRARGDLEELGAAFARALEADKLRPWGRRRLEEHRARGDRMVLASASLEVYVAPLARILGCAVGVGTRLEFDDGVATGRLAGLPCWGEEKLRRVRAALGPGLAIERAYGNGAGDVAVLRAAREGVRL